MSFQIIFADDTVVDLLSNYKDNEFSTLVDAIKKAGMEETLKGRELAWILMTNNSFIN